MKQMPYSALPLGRLRVRVREPGERKPSPKRYRYDEVPEGLREHVDRGMAALAEAPDPTIARRYTAPGGVTLYVWYLPKRRKVDGHRTRVWPPPAFPAQQG